MDRKNNGSIAFIARQLPSFRKELRQLRSSQEEIKRQNALILELLNHTTAGSASLTLRLGCFPMGRNHPQGAVTVAAAAKPESVFQFPSLPAPPAFCARHLPFFVCHAVMLCAKCRMKLLFGFFGSALAV